MLLLSVIQIALDVLSGEQEDCPRKSKKGAGASPLFIIDAPKTGNRVEVRIRPPREANLFLKLLREEQVVCQHGCNPADTKFG